MVEICCQLMMVENVSPDTGELIEEVATTQITKFKTLFEGVIPELATAIFLNHMELYLSDYLLLQSRVVEMDDKKKLELLKWIIGHYCKNFAHVAEIHVSRIILDVYCQLLWWKKEGLFLSILELLNITADLINLEELMQADIDNLGDYVVKKSCTVLTPTANTLKLLGGVKAWQRKFVPFQTKAILV